MVLFKICHSDANDYVDGDIVVYNDDDDGGCDENRDHQYTIKVWGMHSGSCLLEYQVLFLPHSSSVDFLIY